jgi:hypothetical protein
MFEVDYVLFGDLHVPSSIAGTAWIRCQRPCHPDQSLGVHLLASYPSLLPVEHITKSVRLFQNIPDASHDFNRRKECEIIIILAAILCLLYAIFVALVRRSFCAAKRADLPDLGHFAIVAHHPIRNCAARQQ